MVYKPLATTAPPEMLNSLHFLAEKEFSYVATIAQRALARCLGPDWAKTCPHRQELPLGTPRPAGRPAVLVDSNRPHNVSYHFRLISSERSALATNGSQFGSGFARAALRGRCTGRRFSRRGL